jgi:hypothetical protein
LRKSGNKVKQCINYLRFRREILYNILIEFGIPMELVKLVKMCLTETYSRVCAGKHFDFAIEYAILRVQVNQDCMKLNGTHQLLVYADDVNPLMPNGHYSGRTAPLTSRRCILNIYSTNICTEYFKHAA